jgi:hypothetical protein
VRQLVSPRCWWSPWATVSPSALAVDYPTGMPGAPPIPPFGTSRALTADQIALAERMRANGRRLPVIAQTLGVSRATMSQVLAEKVDRMC